MWQLPPLTPEEILLYSRKSRTDDPTKTVEEVLANHEQMLDEWVERNLPGQGRIPESNRYREVVSGETLESRPAVQEVLRRMETPTIKAILIVEPQRLSRGDLEDIGRLVKLLRYTNTLVATTQYTYDIRDDRDRDQFERELKRGNEYLEYQKRIMSNGRLLSVQNGNYIGQHAPYGYKKIQYKEGRRKCYTLEIVEDEAPAVKVIFDLYAKGYGSSYIADRLMEMGYKPRGGGYWQENVIRDMLCNEHYIGKVRWNRKKNVKTVEDGEIITHRRTTKDYLIYPGKQPAIIDPETWDAVQARRGTIPPNKKASNVSNPLAGLLLCSCGKMMRRHAYAGRAEPRFQCPQQKRCGNASCRVSEIMEEVRDAIKETLEDFEIRIEAKEDDVVEMHRQNVARMERRLAELKELEISQWDEKIKGKIPPHVFDRLNSQTLQEIAEVKQALCDAQNAVPEPVNLEEKQATFHEALRMIDDPEASTRDLNGLLKKCIEKIVYTRPKTPGKKARWETGNPIELDIELKV